MIIMKHTFKLTVVPTIFLAVVALITIPRHTTTITAFNQSNVIQPQGTATLTSTLGYLWGIGGISLVYFLFREANLRGLSYCHQLSQLLGLSASTEDRLMDVIQAMQISMTKKGINFCQISPALAERLYHQSSDDDSVLKEKKFLFLNSPQAYTYCSYLGHSTEDQTKADGCYKRVAKIQKDFAKGGIYATMF